MMLISMAMEVIYKRRSKLNVVTPTTVVINLNYEKGLTIFTNYLSK